MMLDIVSAAGVTALELVILALFVPTFGWIAIAFWNAVVGFVLELARRDPISLAGLPRRSNDTGPIISRTALVMPARDEDPRRLVAGLTEIVRSLEETGQAGHFDVHLLSDTTDPVRARAEDAAWEELRSKAPRPSRLHYRRRATNTGRKAGNIGDFCETLGDDYDFLVVLDADSLMSGPTLVELVRLMEANPRAGLIQTVPIPARQETLFGRFVQFAAALYSPMLATGQAFWQTESANYWGHNAIVRVRPFVEHCGLPILPGRPPLGGPVLSHDFVEAALLRRAGWRVYLDPTLGGSHEEVPANLFDYASRDRRWAQGSLQHLRLLGLPGLTGMSRLHFALGAMGYLSSVLWLLLLLCSTAYVLVPALSASPLWAEGAWVGIGAGSARGSWIGVGADGGLRLVPLLGLTAAILFVPKVLGVALALVKRRRAFGGAATLVSSALLEAVFSILIAPVMMVYHTRFVVGILAGRDVAWEAQPREGRTVGWSESLRRTVGIVVPGVVWALTTLYLSPGFFLWMTPIFGGLVLAAPLARWTSDARVGRALRSRGLLLAPSELGRGHRALPTRERIADPLPMFTAVDRPRARTPRHDMHQVERGLFELGRGRLLCVQPSGDTPGGAVLCASVEGLAQAGFESLKRLGSGPVRLIVTRLRAETMGLRLDSPCVSLGLNGETAGQVFTISSARDGFDATRLDARPATSVEAAALALTRLGRLLPAVVSVPARPDRVPELSLALERAEILGLEADRILEATAGTDAAIDILQVSDAWVPLEEAEDARFMLFRETNGLVEHVAILIGERKAWPDPVPVRLHSACLTGDLFGSLRCDCGEQLRGSLRSFAKRGGGVLLYLQQEGRGIGLGNKLRAYALQQEGLDTVDADRVLGFGPDERSYDAAVGMLRHLGIQRVQLLTNNPEKVQALEAGGIRVIGREPLHGTLNRHNLPYVRAKVQRAGHWLGDMLHGASPGA
jgi:membrane glycosyltransferase